jgi:hypothetical protein
LRNPIFPKNRIGFLGSHFGTERFEKSDFSKKSDFLATIFRWSGNFRFPALVVRDSGFGSSPEKPNELYLLG